MVFPPAPTWVENSRHHLKRGNFKDKLALTENKSYLFGL